MGSDLSLSRLHFRSHDSDTPFPMECSRRMAKQAQDFYSTGSLLIHAAALHLSRGLNVVLEATEGNCRVLSRRVMIVIVFL